MRIMKFILASLVVLGASVSFADNVCANNAQPGLFDPTSSASAAAVVAPGVGQALSGQR